MDTVESSNDLRHATLEDLRRELARQDDALAEAASQLRARGPALVTVARGKLDAIDTACLVGVSSLAPAAIRG